MNTFNLRKAMSGKSIKFGLLLGAAMLVPNGVARAQENAAPRIAVQPASQVRLSEASSQDVFQNVAWRGRYYYGRPYGAYYGPPRGRYYARYPAYYDPYYVPYYGGYEYGYGYRGSYYGTPRAGYYRGPYGGNAVRVGPLRFGW